MQTTLKTILQLLESITQIQSKRSATHHTTFRLWCARFKRINEPALQEFVTLFREKLKTLLDKKEELDTKYVKDKNAKVTSKEHLTLLDVINLPTYEMNDSEEYQKEFIKIVAEHDSELKELQESLDIEINSGVFPISEDRIPEDLNNLQLERIEPFTEIE